MIAVQLHAQSITNKLDGISESETFDITDSSDNVLLRIEGNGEFGIGTVAPAANLDVHGTVSLLGVNSSITYNQNILAITDGIVVAYGDGACGYVAGYTDASSTPTTQVVRAECCNNEYINICMPVKKGNYFRVEISGMNTGATWIPLGK